MKQEIAFDVLKSGQNVFLTGSPGTGKTFVVNKYINFLRKNNLKFAVVAPTGIAASHIGGSTVQSFFGLGIKDKFTEMDIDIISQNKYIYERIKDLKVLVVDEISMLAPELFIAIDMVLRSFLDTSKAFGGVQLVLSGDFFQLPPVSKEKKIQRFAYQIDLWERADLKVCYLSEKFRQKEGEELLSILEEIRSGSVSEESMEIFRSRYNKDPEDAGGRITRLYTHNIDVERINLEELSNLSGNTHFFKSESKGAKKDIEKIFSSSLVRETVELKEGAIVVFIKNNFKKGYINGTIGKVSGFNSESGVPIVEIFSGREIEVDMEDWTKENDSGKVIALVRQIPLRLAWAMTIHKAQGMTLDSAEVDLSKTFEIGQGYVALSRIKGIEGLKLVGLNKKALEVDSDVVRIDKILSRKSKENEKTFKGYTQDDKRLLARSFVEVAGGDFVDVSFLDKGIKKTKEMYKKNDRYDGTKELIEKGMQLKDIASELGLKTKTVIRHLEILQTKYPKLNLNAYSPSPKEVADVKMALEQTGFQKTPKGDIRLKPIYEFMNGRVSYDTISLALLFIGVE